VRQRRRAPPRQLCRRRRPGLDGKADWAVRPAQSWMRTGVSWEGRNASVSVHVSSALRARGRTAPAQTGARPSLFPAARFDAWRRVSQAGAPARLTVLRVITPAQEHTPRKTTMRCRSNRCLPTQRTSDLHSWQT